MSALPIAGTRDRMSRYRRPAKRPTCMQAYVYRSCRPTPPLRVALRWETQSSDTTLNYHPPLLSLGRTVHDHLTTYTHYAGRHVPTYYSSGAPCASVVIWPNAAVPRSLCSVHSPPAHSLAGSVLRYCIPRSRYVVPSGYLAAGAIFITALLVTHDVGYLLSLESKGERWFVLRRGKSGSECIVKI